MLLLRKSLKSLLPKYQLRTLATKSIGIDVVDPRIGLTDDQIQYLNLARNFADKELFPNAKRWDEESIFPVDVFEKFGSLGFGGISVDSDYGGSNLSRVDNVVIVENLATGCVGTTAMLTIHNMCAGMIDRFGNEQQKRKYLPGLCSMDIKASYCLTEPGSGSDAASLSTTAIFDTKTNEYVVNGGKSFISGAGLSDIYLVMCRTGKESITCLLVPKDTKGLSFGANEKKMGWKCQPTKQLIFEDMRIPVSHRIGREGEGFQIAMIGLDGGRLSIGACSLGASQKVFEIAVQYVKERKQFGKAISQNQSVQFKLADMAGYYLCCYQIFSKPLIKLTIIIIT